jgi:hypothetical protein
VSSTACELEQAACLTDVQGLHGEARPRRLCAVRCRRYIKIREQRAKVCADVALQRVLTRRDVVSEYVRFGIAETRDIREHGTRALAAAHREAVRGFFLHVVAADRQWSSRGQHAANALTLRLRGSVAQPPSGIAVYPIVLITTLGG